MSDSKTTCPSCGKRLGDGIHTCSPQKRNSEAMTPQEAIKLLRDNMQTIYEYWNGASESAVDAIEEAKEVAGQALAATEQVDDGMVLPELGDITPKQMLKWCDLYLRDLVPSATDDEDNQAVVKAIRAAIAKIGEGK